MIFYFGNKKKYHAMNCALTENGSKWKIRIWRTSKFRLCFDIHPSNNIFPRIVSCSAFNWWRDEMCSIVREKRCTHGVCARSNTLPPSAQCIHLIITRTSEEKRRNNNSNQQMGFRFVCWFVLCSCGVSTETDHIRVFFYISSRHCCLFNARTILPEHKKKLLFHTS